MSPTAVPQIANATIKDVIVPGAAASDRATKPSLHASNAKESKQVNTATPLKVTDLCHFILGILRFVSFTLLVDYGSITHYLGKTRDHKDHRNKDGSQTACSDKADRRHSSQPATIG